MSNYISNKKLKDILTDIQEFIEKTWNDDTPEETENSKKKVIEYIGNIKEDKR